MRKTRLFPLLLVFTAASVGILSLTFSSIPSSVIIANTGKVTTSTIVADSGSIGDVQEAINVVHTQGSGTVLIPSGTYDWDIFPQKGPNGYKCSVLSYGGINVMGAGIGQTILRQTRIPSVDVGSMIAVEGGNGYPARISGISFEGYIVSETENTSIGITMGGCVDYRIDRCSFDNFGQGVNAENCGGGPNWVNRGVIDHCTFDNTYKLNVPPPGGWLWGYGIIVWDVAAGTWNDINTLLGKYEDAVDIAYVEDCTFNRCRHAISESQSGYYVLRYCNITNEVPPNFGAIDVHGFNHGRGCEAYNNIVTATLGYSGAQAVWLRGGTSTVFNNTFVDCRYGVLLYSESETQYQVQNTYIWGNTMIGNGTMFQDASGAYIQGVNYFLYARPGYTPFTYPHPLTLIP